MDYLCYTKRLEEHGHQMDAMMVQHGIDRATAESVDGQLGWLTACARCIFCQKLDICSKWLAGDAVPLSTAEFCPNASFFEACRITDPG